MRSHSAAWIPLGVLAAVILVGGLTSARRPSPVRPALASGGSALRGSQSDPRATPTETLLRYEISSNALPLSLLSTGNPPPAGTDPMPLLTSESRLKARFGEEGRVMDRLELAMQKPDRTPSWMASVADWLGGRRGGLGFFVPKWSSCPQLVAHGEEAAGWGMGLQYRLNF